MICPNCTSEMEEGEVQVRGSMLSFLVVGFSIQDLMFDSSSETTTILPSRDTRKAYYCRQCGGVFIQGSDPNDTTDVEPIISIV